MDLVKWTCTFCNHNWWEDCDAQQYPEYCPVCGYSHCVKKTDDSFYVDHVEGE